MAERYETAAQAPLSGYRISARVFHWTTALAVAVMLTTGFWMTWRGNELGIWDGLTNGLYSTHKLLGFLILWFTVLRLLNRLLLGAPPPEPTLSAPQRTVAALNHWALYGLLIAMPLLGWTAASLFPARELFGLFSLPAIAAPDPTPDKEAYEWVAWWHGTGALAVIALATLHIAATIYHRFVRRDGVFARMWQGRR